MKKQDILNAAYESFINFGYKGTTMDKIAKIANVGKGTIYNFFNNKEELLSQIVKEHLKDLKEVAQNLEDENLSVEENLQRILEGIFKFKKENQLIIKLIKEEKIFATKEVIDILTKVDQEIVGYIKSKVQYYIDKGLIKECNPEITAFVIMKLYITLISDWEINNKPFTKEELVELFNLYIFTGIKK